MVKTPAQLLRDFVVEQRDWWAGKSRKGGVAEPTVVAGVLEGVRERIDELFPNARSPVQGMRKVVLRKKASR